jgi:hypothetical protein
VSNDNWVLEQRLKKIESSRVMFFKTKAEL